MAGEALTLTLEGREQLLAKMHRLPEALRRSVGARGLRQAGLLLERFIKTEELTGQVLHVRSGRLRSSVTTSEVQETEASDLFVKIGPHTVYARIHEYGGTITPKRSQYLTIPLPAARTGAGVGRYSARALIANPAIGGFVRTFFKHHKLYGVTAGGKVKAVFVLKRSVTLPKRPYMAPALQKNERAVIGIITQAVDDALQSL